MFHHSPNASVVGAEPFGDLLIGVALHPQLQDLSIFRSEPTEEVFEFIEKRDGGFGRGFLIETLEQSVIDGILADRFVCGVALRRAMKRDLAQRFAHRHAHQKLADVVIGQLYVAVLDAVEETAEDRLHHVFRIDALRQPLTDSDARQMQESMNVTVVEFAGGVLVAGSNAVEQGTTLIWRGHGHSPPLGRSVPNDWMQRSEQPLRRLGRDP